jgi:hypothetical protein
MTTARVWQIVTDAVNSADQQAAESTVLDMLRDRQSGASPVIVQHLDIRHCQLRKNTSIILSWLT